LVNMAILPFPRDNMPLEPQGTAISGASKAPKSQFYVAVSTVTPSDR